MKRWPKRVTVWRDDLGRLVCQPAGNYRGGDGDRVYVLVPTRPRKAKKGKVRR